MGLGSPARAPRFCPGEETLCSMVLVGCQQAASTKHAPYPYYFYVKDEDFTYAGPVRGYPRRRMGRGLARRAATRYLHHMPEPLIDPLHILEVDLRCQVSLDGRPGAGEIRPLPPARGGGEGQCCTPTIQAAPYSPTPGGRGERAEAHGARQAGAERWEVCRGRGAARRKRTGRRETMKARKTTQAPSSGPRFCPFSESSARATSSRKRKTLCDGAMGEGGHRSSGPRDWPALPGRLPRDRLKVAG